MYTIILVFPPKSTFLPQIMAEKTLAESYTYRVFPTISLQQQDADTEFQLTPADIPSQL